MCLPYMEGLKTVYRIMRSFKMTEKSKLVRIYHFSEFLTKHETLSRITLQNLSNLCFLNFSFTWKENCALLRSKRAMCPQYPDATVFCRDNGAGSRAPSGPHGSSGSSGTSEFSFLLVLFVLHLQSTQQAIIVLPYRHKKYIKQIRNGNWSEMSLRQSLVGRQKTRAR